MSPDPLPVDSLTLRIDAAQLGFTSTDELDDSEEVIGQDRAVEAMQFGVEIRAPGYNLFLLGPQGLGKQHAILSLLKEKAAAQETPSDWVYVSSFSEREKPNAMRLPPARGHELATAMENFIEEIRASVPAYLENEENQTRLRVIEEEFRQKPEQELEALRERAAAQEVALIRTPTGFGFTPLSGDQIIKPEVFNTLPQEQRAGIEAKIEAFQKELQEILKRIPRVDKQRREALRVLLAEVTEIAIGVVLEPVVEAFRGLGEVEVYLEAVRRDLIENFHKIQAAEKLAERATDDGAPIAGMTEVGGFERYKVNPLVTREDRSGAPVVFENHPTLFNLTGRIEHISRYGALFADFNRIRAGALHRANGGYLVIDARKLLLQPFAWDALKRALKAGHITIESPGQNLGLISTLSLEPEPIPLDIKIALLGDRLLYYLLCEFDPEFPDLFKVESDFDDVMPSDEGCLRQFARLVACRVRQDGLLAFDASAVGEVIRRAVRLAGDRRKLSLDWRAIGDLLQEASFYANQAKAAKGRCVARSTSAGETDSPGRSDS